MNDGTHRFRRNDEQVVRSRDRKCKSEIRESQKITWNENFHVSMDKHAKTWQATGEEICDRKGSRDSEVAGKI